MPSAPQAKFQFVATGSPEVQAQAEAINRKLIEMKARARAAASETREGMHKAHLATHLLNEEMGLHIPRAMQQVISRAPGLSSALAAAFSVTAVIGFVEIINTLINKMPELADSIMGFGEEAKKAFEELKKGNEAIVKALEANEKQALRDALLGLSGSKLDAATKQQLIAERDKLQQQAAAIGRQTSNVRLGLIRPTSIAPSGEEVPDIRDEDIAQANKMDEQVQKLKAQITALNGAIESTGKHFSHDIGQEGKTALEKAQSALRPILDMVSEKGKNGLQQGIDAAGKSFNENIAKVQKFGHAFGLTVPQIQAVISQLEALRAAAQNSFSTVYIRKQFEDMFNFLQKQADDAFSSFAERMALSANPPQAPARVKQHIQELTVTLSDLGKAQQGIIGGIEQGFIGMASGTETVSQAFQHMASSILQSLAKVIFQMFIVQALTQALGNIFGGTGEVVDTTPLVNAPSVIPHAMGGPTLSGMTYLVGERGPELLTMGAGGYVTPNHMIGQGGKAPVINIHNYGPPMETSQSSRFDGEQFVVDVVVRNIQNNGPIRQQLR